LKYILTFVAAIFLVSSSQALYQTPVPENYFGKEVIIESRKKDSGELMVAEKIDVLEDGSELVLVSTKQRKDNGLTIKTTTFYNLEDEKLTCIAQTSKVLKDKDLISVKQTNFDWDNMVALISTTDSKNNKTKQKTIKLTPKTILSESSYFYFSDLIRNHVEKADFVMIPPDGKSYKMKVSVSYEPREITVQGEKVNCYEIEMKPDMGFLTAFVPKLMFWYTVSSPHNFVRYEGLARGLGTPHIIQEIVN